MPNPVFIDARRGRVIGSVLDSWFEYDADNGVTEQYVSVLTRDGVEERCYCGGYFYAIDLDDGSLYVEDQRVEWERTSRIPQRAA